ncbi:hypothetical protein ABAC460_18610 [Asticcacaulis sp. AC460]|uniref:hypothetical protein n=1 Tax=Asticcacaulis sp. AC460 TaxID=1282360 RepID=UPI0003C3D4C9|nr:hypothetical protein [Asticcacaulis sp. AC460]ESQ87686.1 hypothetical protein ABAC460_18610 [Asticcacaulis sp. AC460]
MLRYALALALLISPAVATAADKTAYDTAIEHAELFDQLGDTLLTGVSALLDTGSDAADVCPDLESAALDWNKAAGFYDQAIAAPKDAKDTARASDAVLTDARDFSLKKASEGQRLFDTYCKGVKAPG